MLTLNPLPPHRHTIRRFRLAATLVAAAVASSIATTANAQAASDLTPSRVLTAALPIPMSDKADRPLPPDQLCAESP